MSMDMVLSLIGGIGLFLYGMNLLSSSMQSIAGGRLERTLEKLTSNKWMAFLLGTAVTAVIQSSGATTIMLVGFVNAGIMKLVQAIPVMMGANIGTTVTAQILRLADIDGSAGGFSVIDLFKPSSFAPVLVCCGAFVVLMSKKKKTQSVASIFVGFGLLFVGMSMMESALNPLKDNPEVIRLLTTFRNPFLGVLLGVAVTTLLQSSSAAVGILQTIAATGTITFEIAAPIVIGMNIGKCVPVVIASFGTNKNARRVVIVDLIMNSINAVLFITVIYTVQAIHGWPFWTAVMSRSSIANFHSLFNIVMSLTQLPFVNQLAAASGRILKDDAPDKGDETLALLDPIFEKTPSLALDQCKKVVDAMGATVYENIGIAYELCRNYDEKKREVLDRNETFLDRCETAIGNYLVRVNAQSMSKTENRRSSELLSAVGDFERIGDHCVNIASVGEYNQEQGITFSEDGLKELAGIFGATSKIIELTVKAFEREDLTLANRVGPLEEVIDTMKQMLKDHHIYRLQNGSCGVQAGISFLEILTDMERISDHCKSISIYVIQRVKGVYFTDKHEADPRQDPRETEEFKAMYTYYRSQYVEPLKKDIPSDALL